MAPDTSPVERDRAEGMIETVLGLVPDATVIVDKDGLVVAVNNAVEELFGYERDELVGQAIELLVPERHRARHRSQRTTFLGHPKVRPMGAGLQLLGRRKDGSEFPVDISLAPIHTGERMLGVAAVRDVTERRRTEQELRRLLAASEHHARCQRAISEIRMAGLNGQPVEEVLDLIVRHTVDLTPATGAFIVWCNDGKVVAAAGAGQELLGEVVTAPTPSGEGPSWQDAHEQAEPWDQVFAGGSVVALRVRDTRPQGDAVLVCGRRDGAGEVAAEDASVITGMVQLATVAVELSHARDVRMQLLLADERERIARDLHDHAVQGLFATGLGLQSLLPVIDNPQVAARVNESVDSLDGVIKQIRTAIFTLSQPSEMASGLRAEVIRLTGRAARGLGFEPTVLFDGPVDVSVPAELAGHALAVVHEALSNVARHAHATTASVELRVTPSEFEVIVSDDGAGFVGPGIGRGLGNLRSRAVEVGGDFAVTSGPGSGTRLTWRVPLT